MTKEELKKEAEEWLLKNSGYSKNEFHGRKAIKAYIAGAETREKRIEELKEYLLQEREIYWCKGFECGRKKNNRRNLQKQRKSLRNYWISKIG